MQELVEAVVVVGGLLDDEEVFDVVDELVEI